MNKRLTVSELTAQLAEVVTGEFSDVAVEGEISGFKAHSSGHWYFSMKDANAVLSCAMFRGDNQRVRRPPRDGDRIVASGGLSVYPPRGAYSLIVRRMEPVGAGDLLRQLEERKARLAAEGLFDAARKRRLPPLPSAIGVATSPTGAAFQDILRVLRQRFPAITVYLAPCKVQGEGAAAEIAAAIELLNQHGKSQALIVGRGGGSVEDLWAFNEEVVVRAVARSALPVVSAVGHEVDVSLCDLAADVRAATPSHAAELATPVAADLHGWVEEQQERMLRAMDHRIHVLRERVSRIRVPHPREGVARGRLRCDELDERAQVAIARTLQRRRERLAARAQHLDALSPLAVLVRGYAIVAHAGAPVKDATTLTPGDAVQLRLARGRADATIVRVHPP